MSKANGKGQDQRDRTGMSQVNCPAWPACSLQASYLDTQPATGVPAREAIQFGHGFWETALLHSFYGR